MGLIKHEVAFHRVDDPTNVRVISLLTGEDRSSVEDYLVRTYGSGAIVLRYASPEPETVWHTRTCGYCGCSRRVREEQGKKAQPGLWNKDLWKQL